MLQRLVSGNRAALVAMAWACALAALTGYRLLTDLNAIAELRSETAALCARNEQTARRLEASVRAAASDLAASDRDAADTDEATLAGLRAARERVTNAVAKARQELRRDAGGGAPKHAAGARHDGGVGGGVQGSPLVFARGGSHRLDGSKQLLALEKRWGYELGSDALQLHRHVLGQVVIAMRVLEGLCAVEAWRAYLDGFIKWMERRSDTMLYNWI
jgi:hypothetical protein